MHYDSLIFLIFLWGGCTVALIRCPECSKEISDKADACPTCGFPISKHKVNHASRSTVTCMGCNRAFSLEDDICPHCGLKYTSHATSPSPTLPPQTTPSVKDGNGHLLVQLILLIFAAVIVSSVTGSVILTVLSILLGVYVITRVETLASSPSSKNAFDRYVLSWKGFVTYLFIAILFTTTGKAYESHQKRTKEEAAKQEQLKNNARNLAAAKKMLQAPDTLTYAQLLSLRTQLSSLDKATREYPEAQSLLKIVEPKIKELAKAEQARIAKQAKIDEQKRKEEAKKQFERETAGLSPKAKRLKAKHPEWTIEECDTISKGKIRIGMTKEQVKAAWGAPYDVNRSTYSFGVHEQWVMSEYGGSYVYFEDGICTSIQN